MPSQTESTGIHSRKMLFAEIPALFYLIISDCHASRHNPLLHTFTGNNVIHCRYIFARNGILPPLYRHASVNGQKGENKIRCMRVLLNCFGFFKPATIITEKGRFSECQIALFIADICHLLAHKKISLRTVIVQRLISFNIIQTNVFIGNMYSIILKYNLL